MGAGILWVIVPSFAAHASPLRCTPPTLTCAPEVAQVRSFLEEND